MKQRLTLWFVAGLVIASSWVFFVAAIPQPSVIRRPLWYVIEITAPAALLRHLALKYYWFILLNGLIYFAFGLMIEMWRRHLPSHSSDSTA